MKDVGRENSWAGIISNQLSKQGEKFEWLGGKLRGMGDAMRPVSTLVATGFTLATRKAIEFEDQMNTTKSLLADTVPTVEELNTTTKRLGESSKDGRNNMGFLRHLLTKDCKKSSRKVLMLIKLLMLCQAS